MTVAGTLATGGAKSMSSRENQDEIDFLMEREFHLSNEVSRIRARLETLLGQDVVGRVVERPRHLTVVPDPDEGA